MLMSVSTLLVYDAIHANVSKLPAGQAAGYMTGSGIVPWTSADWAAHPGAVRIDQTPANTTANETADVLDIENGAATPSEAAGWAKAALTSYATVRRPGQRRPVVYVNESNKTAVVNALVAGGVKSGIGIWLADYNYTVANGVTAVSGASGPFPIIGVQFRDAGNYDVSVMSEPWLRTVSAVVTDTSMTIKTLPPGTWHAGGIVSLTGPAPSGTAWTTHTTDGEHWSAPVRA
jgi:hypothetical protein